MSTTQPLMTWPDLQSRPQPAPDRTLVYGEDALQVVDLWLPTGTCQGRPHPIVLMIHGGCWETATAERDIMNWVADDLRQWGIAVWNIEYRGVDRGGGWPGTYLDVGAAADMLAREGAALDLDLSHIVALGHSAGGHLALWLGNRPALAVDDALRGADPIQLHSIISTGGIPDLVFQSTNEGHGCGTASARAMMGPDLSRCSPPAMAPGPARQIQINAMADRIAPPDYAEAYAAMLVAKGVVVENHIVPGEGHVELVTPGTQSWAATLALMERELNRDET